MAKRQTYNDLVKEYRKLAKRADQRLVRLEKLSTQKDFKQVKSWAYKNAATDAALWGANPDKPRFNIAPPKNKTSLQAKIQDIKNFLDKPTSKKSEIINIYQKKADTLNEKYIVRDEKGKIIPEKSYQLNLNWSDVGTLFESAAYKKLSAKFGSGTALKAIATIRQSEEEFLKDVEQHKASHIRTEDGNMFVDEAIKRATRYYKDDVKKLLNLI